MSCSLKDLWGISEIKCRLHPLRKKGNKTSESEVTLPRHGGKNSDKEIARFDGIRKVSFEFHLY